MQRIVTFLWFDEQAEEAANFYTSVFAGRPGADMGGGPSKIGDVSYYGEAGPGTPGSVMTVSFQLEGQEFEALNGGPDFRFTEAVSLMVNCESQEEVDYFWEALLAGGGTEDACGWLKDRYGLSWQIVPTVLEQLLTDPDREKSQRVMRAMLEMVKLDIAALQRAAAAA
jgi:predicted 3-demethylubiquinone-9 3-methyltransferase (glyoxalase superfamily)